ncbi:TPM domain-containing protein [Ideonella dechloratans]|uniref:TPM domain-containing protein n=1 Tax=Ideonella dechloratans TaxID=36863 RepID=A0A643FBQ1_IDEDE|nr:TPM domain-containing protein [Ideonella dechloratans]KAB0582458.1 TPM domain-containing protein [Ideonella dechloratans]UFU10501.1 TPM domain-containing protein [Ideonella dechloratans]
MNHATLGSRLRRAWRHFWLDERDSRRALPPAALQRLTALVQASEARHRGQIRLCVEASLPMAAAWAGVAPRQRALECFGQLGVWDTEDNVGVLIYVLLADRAVEIVADRGLRHHVPEARWQALAQGLGQAFAQGQVEAGLTTALAEVDRLLCAGFARAEGSPRSNELPDTPVLR